jgi:hypothetical protein
MWTRFQHTPHISFASRLQPSSFRPLEQTMREEGRMRYTEHTGRSGDSKTLLAVAPPDVEFSRIRFAQVCLIRLTRSGSSPNASEP